MLERVGSANMEPSELIARDRVRHECVFRSSSLHGLSIFLFRVLPYPSKVRPHYNLKLLSISISGQTVTIHSLKVFPTSKNRRGAVVDFGSTFAYLTEEAYDPFVNDVVLKDKVIVYDLARQRLGWAEYDCSSSVNVVPLRVSSSSRNAVLYHRLIPLANGGVIMYISMFASFLYL